MSAHARGFWLLKSEPSEFSFDDLWAAPGRSTAWEGVRNYQARNFLRDQMRVGDSVLFYHSNAQPTGVAGVAEVARGAFADPTQFERGHERFDAASTPAAPRWYAVEIVARRRLPRVVTLAELQRTPALAAMGVVQRGSRLSVQPVTRAEFECVLALARADSKRSR